MQDELKVILTVQELDIKMVRLLRVKKERQQELAKIRSLQTDMRSQVEAKESEITEIKKEIRMGETQMKEFQEKIAKLETQQAAVKKMDEFNALTKEMTQAGRERNLLEQKLSDLMDKQATEEDVLTSLREHLTSTEASSATLEKEIHESIAKINEEGATLLKERESHLPQTQPELLAIYEKLIKNKKDRVVVPIENRVCSGCHIVLTAQHENLVRRGDRLVFCEHCSRILYWQEPLAPEVGEEEVKPRRRRRAATAA